LSTPGGDAPATGTAAQFAPFDGVNRLSRFTLSSTWQLGGEATILDVPTSRGMCCHVGGDIDFDAAGNLYLTTGDDSNPFESNGYSPLDERTDRNPVYDAQRSARYVRMNVLVPTSNTDAAARIYEFEANAS
jgi:glucose/arabinose dehydrogenase